MPRILLTQAVHPRAESLLAKSGEVVVAPDLSADTLRRSAQGCDVIVVRAPLPDDIFTAAPTLIGAVRHGAGVDMIPIDAATARGVLVANVPGVNANAVAEHVAGQMIRLARLSLPMAMRLADRDASSWSRARALANDGVELSGCTVGVVGYGHVGQAIVRICVRGFGMRAVACARSAVADADPSVRLLRLHELLPCCDFLVLACPLTAETRGLIGLSQLMSMRRGAWLINVARGPIVQEAALVEALKSGQLAGAALDVFDAQPLPGDHPFWTMEQVLVTPHVAGITDDSMQRMGETAAAAVGDLLAGRMPKHCINPQARAAFEARVATQRRRS